MKRNRFVNSCVSELEQDGRDHIAGYEYLHIMSLEEAVHSIIPIVPDVMKYVDTARRLCRQNTELTIDESAAIYLYTMQNPFHQKLNQTLRAQEPRELEPWFGYVKLFLNAVEKLPSCRTTIWRGISSIIDTYFAEDGVHTWFSVNSCTSKIGVAGMFEGEIGTLLCIETFHGKDITAYSAKPDEDEVLLLPGIRLQVKDKFSENGILIVHLQEW